MDKTEKKQQKQQKAENKSQKSTFYTQKSFKTAQNRRINPQNKGYSEAGASYQKKALKGFRALSGSPVEDIDFNNATLRNRSRVLTMASPVASSAIKTNRTNVVGLGLKMNCRIDRKTLGMTSEQADEFQQNVEREWELWAKNPRMCDATGMNSFYAMQRLALISWLSSGDVFAVIQQAKATAMLPYSTRIMLVEADRCATPQDSAMKNAPVYTTGINEKNGNKIYDGVEVNKNGLIVAYHFRNTYPFEYGTTDTLKWVRVKAYDEKTNLYNVIQIKDDERCSQYRGVPYLAPVIEQLLQLRRYTESELMAAVIESFFTAFIKTTADTDENPFNETDPIAPGEEYERGENDYNLGPATINVMEPGEDVTFANPTRPAGGFDGFVNAIANQIGAALEIPKDLLLKEFNASYSASRAALLEAWKAFKMRREILIENFCEPAYAVWFAEAVARGRIKAPGFFTNPRMRAAYLGTEWVGPSQGQLDPVKEVTAETLAIAEGFSTHEQSTAKLTGNQWSRNIEQLKKERTMLGGLPPDPHQSGSTSAPEPNQDEDDDDGQGGNPMENMIRKIVVDEFRNALEEFKNGKD